ncbi:MAG: sensor histidine kinase [Chloroflexota bacterium]
MLVANARRLSQLVVGRKAIPTPSGWPLELRIPLFVGLVLTLLLAAFGFLGLTAVQDSRQQALEQQRLIARAAAEHVDQNLRQALDILYRAAALPVFTAEEGSLETKKEALSDLYRQTGLFQKTLFLTDRQGTVLWAEPNACRVELGSNVMYQPNVSIALISGQATVSGVECSLAAREPVACLTVPIRDPKGETVGLIGGALDLSGDSVAGFLSALRLGETGYAQVVDQEGVVLAATDDAGLFRRGEHGERFATLIAQKRETVGTCHSCHESGQQMPSRREVLAFAPLSAASWGVAVAQSEDEVLAPSRTLQQRLLLLTLLSVAVALLVAWMGMRSFTRPLAKLTLAAERIASGDLSGGVQLGREDEIGRLAKAFESMRIRLRLSLAEIQDWNRDLESRVRQRTLELERSRGEIAHLYGELQQQERARSELLEKVITAQEEERKRIARELHDETSQSLAALVFVTEAAARQSDNGGDVQDRLERMRSLAVDTLDGVQRITFDLRPTLLDDLGLAAALRWYAESRLGDGGVRIHTELSGEQRRLRPGVETAVYRVVQEAITNVAKHAEATNVSISLDFQETDLVAEVEDDGRGFDVDAAVGGQGAREMGLLGMRERMALVGGSLKIHSRRGAGTRVVVRVPLG